MYVISDSEHNEVLLIMALVTYSYHFDSASDVFEWLCIKYHIICMTKSLKNVQTSPLTLVYATYLLCCVLTYNNIGSLDGKALQSKC